MTTKPIKGRGVKHYFYTVIQVFSISMSFILRVFTRLNINPRVRSTFADNLPLSSLGRMRNRPRSLVYTIHRLWIKPSKHSQCLLVHGKYQCMSWGRTHHRYTPTSIQSHPSFSFVHLQEYFNEGSFGIIRIGTHLTPYRISGIKCCPVGYTRGCSTK